MDHVPFDRRLRSELDSPGRVELTGWRDGGWICRHWRKVKALLALTAKSQKNTRPVDIAVSRSTISTAKVSAAETKPAGLAPSNCTSRRYEHAIHGFAQGRQEHRSRVLPSEKLLTEMGKYNEELVKAGVMLAGEGLQPSSKGARVKFSGAKRTVVDGPSPRPRS